MNPNPITFTLEDLCEQPPAPGYYLSTIAKVRFRRSANGNRMLQVLYCLQDVCPHFQLVADYFVLEGASPQAIALARWRLVELYRACGLDPQQGQQIDGSQLLEATVLVAVGHQRWNDHVRLRVVGYRPAWATEGSDLEDTP